MDAAGRGKWLLSPSQWALLSAGLLSVAAGSALKLLTAAQADGGSSRSSSSSSRAACYANPDDWSGPLAAAPAETVCASGSELGAKQVAINHFNAMTDFPKVVHLECSGGGTVRSIDFASFGDAPPQMPPGAPDLDPSACNATESACPPPPRGTGWSCRRRRG